MPRRKAQADDDDEAIPEKKKHAAGRKKKPVEAIAALKAITSDDVDTLKRYIEEGGDLNVAIRAPYEKEPNTTLVSWAAQQKKLDLVKLLLEAGADPNVVCAPGGKKSMSPLEHALNDFPAHMEMVNLLLQHKASAEVGREGALFIAVSRNHVDALRVLLEAGANPNHRRLPGDTTPLFRLTGGKNRGVSQVVDLLAKHGADVNARNSNGSTPLLIIAKHSEAVEALLRNGADPFIANDAGVTAANMIEQARLGDPDLRDAWLAWLKAHEAKQAQAAVTEPNVAAADPAAAAVPAAAEPESTN